MKDQSQEDAHCSLGLRDIKWIICYDYSCYLLAHECQKRY